MSLQGYDINRLFNEMFLTDLPDDIFIYHAMAARNKALITDRINESLVKSINNTYQKAVKSDTSIENFIRQLNSFLGDYTNETEKVEELGATVLDTLLVLNATVKQLKDEVGKNIHWLPPVTKVGIDNIETSDLQVGDRFIVGDGELNNYFGYKNYLIQWNGQDWDVTIPEEGSIAYSFETNSLYTFNGQEWRELKNDSLKIDDWKAQTEYRAGDIVINNNRFYRAKVDHVSGDLFEESNWQALGDTHESGDTATEAVDVFVSAIAAAGIQEDTNVQEALRFIGERAANNETAIADMQGIINAMSADLDVVETIANEARASAENTEAQLDGFNTKINNIEGEIVDIKERLELLEAPEDIGEIGALITRMNALEDEMAQVKEQLDLIEIPDGFEGFDVISQKIANVEADIQSINSKINNLESAQLSTENEVSDIKTEVQTIKDNVQSLQDDVDAIVIPDVAPIENKVNALEADVTNLIDEQQQIKDSLTRTVKILDYASGVDYLKDETIVGPEQGKLYRATQDFTSVSLAEDISNGYLETIGGEQSEKEKTITRNLVFALADELEIGGQPETEFIFPEKGTLKSVQVSTSLESKNESNLMIGIQKRQGTGWTTIKQIELEHGSHFKEELLTYTINRQDRLRINLISGDYGKVLGLNIVAQIETPLTI